MITRLILLMLVLWGSCACTKLRKFVKAKPAELSRFVAHPEQMVRQTPKQAFQYVWSSSNPADHAAARPLTELYIAPVELRHLRPMKQGVTKFKQSVGTKFSEAAPEIARELRRQFAVTMANHPERRYNVALRPGPKSLVLEMAITELNPTEPKTNAAKLAAKIVLGPVGTVGGLAVQSSGNIAVEARLRLPGSRRILYQFADNESDKLTFYSIRDFRPYGHVKKAIEEWARQFAELTRQGRAKPVKDATFWTLSPF